MLVEMMLHVEMFVCSSKCWTIMSIMASRQKCSQSTPIIIATAYSCLYSGANTLPIVTGTQRHKRIGCYALGRSVAMHQEATIH